jgi:hypothetical protein
MIFFMAIDPVPPPSAKAKEKGLMDRDWEVHAVVGVHASGIYVVDVRSSRGHDPDWSIATFFELLEKWRPHRVRVESVAYQATLKWLLEKEMQRRRRWVTVTGADNATRGRDMRKKSYRIIDGISTPLNNNRLFVHRTQTKLIEQISAYPAVSHDDEIEAVAEAIHEAMENPFILEGDFAVLQDDIKELPEWRTCP